MSLSDTTQLIADFLAIFTSVTAETTAATLSEDWAAFISAYARTVIDSDVSAAAQTGTTYSVSTGTVRSQIEELLSAINAVNTALAAQDWQNSALDKDLSTPPAQPSEGDSYIVNPPGAPDTAWEQQDNKIAEWTGKSWAFTTPNEGFIVWVEDEDKFYVFNGSTWVTLDSIVDHTLIQNIGTNTHAQIDSHIGDTSIHFTEGSIDHGSLNGTSLLDDDHTQYLLLAGRSGGQIAYGGTAASDVLSLSGTSHATHGYVRIGSVGTPNKLTASSSGELFVVGKTEFDALVYCDSGLNVEATGLWVKDDVNQWFGDTMDVALKWETTNNTVHTFLVGLSGSNNMIVCEKADMTTDWNRSDTDPTLYIQSADATSTADYIAFRHNQTDAVIASGTGHIQLAPYSNWVLIKSAAAADPNLILVEGSNFHAKYGYNVANKRLEIAAYEATSSIHLETIEGLVAVATANTGENPKIGLYETTTERASFYHDSTANETIFDNNEGLIRITPTTYLHVGTSGTPGLADEDGDLYVYHDLEVDGITQFDGAVSLTSGVLTLPLGTVGAPSLTFVGHTTDGLWHDASYTYMSMNGQKVFEWRDAKTVSWNALQLTDNDPLELGSDPNVQFEWDTGQIIDTLVCSLDSASKSLIVTDYTYRASDHGLGAQSYPTIAMFGGEDPTTYPNKYLKLGYDGPNGRALIGTGQGSLGLTPANDQLIVWGDVIDLKGGGTDSVYLKMGDGGSGNRYAYIDLIGDDTHAYSARLLRNNSGANASTTLRHCGTGDFGLVSEDSAAIVFQVALSERLTLTTTDGEAQLRAASGDPKLAFMEDTTERASLYHDVTNNRFAVESTEGPIRIIPADENLYAKADSFRLLGGGTDSVFIELGAEGSGNRNAYIDLIGDDTYTDYGLRIRRWNSGPNASSALYHRGTGTFAFVAQEAAEINFQIDDVTTVAIPSTQNELQICSELADGTTDPKLSLREQSTERAAILYDTSADEGVFETLAGDIRLRAAGADIYAEGTGLHVTGSGSTSTYIDIGASGTGDRYAYIDLIGDDTYTDYGLRVMRNNGGADTYSELAHRGTGSLRINAKDSGGSILAIVASETRLTLPDTSGEARLNATTGDPKLKLTESGIERASVYHDVTNDQFVIDSGEGPIALKPVTSLDLYTDSGDTILNFYDATPTQVARILWDNSEGWLRIITDEASSELHLEPNTYVHIGSTGTPGLANSDGDLYVYQDLEVDGQAQFDANVDALLGLDVSGAALTASGGLTLTTTGITMTGLNIGAAGTAMGDIFSDGFLNMTVSVAPTPADGSGAVYVKTDTGEELYFKSDSGEVQITKDGSVNASGGSGSLDDAYDVGRTITTDAGPVVFNHSTTSGILDLQPGLIAETAAAIEVGFTTLAYTGTPGGLHIDYSGVTSLSNAGDISAISLEGKTNAGAGDSIGLSIDANFDQGIENAASFVQSGTASFSNGIGLTSGVLTLPLGAVGAPSLIFAGHATDGLYHDGSNPNMVHTGADVMEWRVDRTWCHKHVQIPDGARLNFGSGTDSQLEWDTGQTVDTMVWGLDDTAKSMIFTAKANIDSDHQLAAQNNPTIALFSNFDPENSEQERLLIQHDGSDAVYSTAYGGHKFALEAQRTRGQLRVDGQPVAAETFVLNATTFTAVASGASGDQFNIGATYSDTADNIAAVINSGSESANAYAWRVSDANEWVYVEWLTAGTAGNSIVWTEALTNVVIYGGGTLASTHYGHAAERLEAYVDYYTGDVSLYATDTLCLRPVGNKVKVDGVGASAGQSPGFYISSSYADKASFSWDNYAGSGTYIQTEDESLHLRPYDGEVTLRSRTDVNTVLSWKDYASTNCASITYEDDDHEFIIEALEAEAFIRNQAIFASTATAENVLTLTRLSSGTPAANIGTGLSFEVERAADTLAEIGRIEAICTAVDATPESRLSFFHRNTVGTVVESMRVDENGYVSLFRADGSTYTADALLDMNAQGNEAIFIRNDAVAHGMTSLVDSNVIGAIWEADQGVADAGGLTIYGIGSDSNADLGSLQLFGVTSEASPGSVPVVGIYPRLKSGTSTLHVNEDDLGVRVGDGGDAYYQDILGGDENDWNRGLVVSKWTRWFMGQARYSTTTWDSDGCATVNVSTFAGSVATEATDGRFNKYTTGTSTGNKCYVYSTYFAKPGWGPMVFQARVQTVSEDDLRFWCGFSNTNSGMGSDNPAVSVAAFRYNPTSGEAADTAVMACTRNGSGGSQTASSTSYSWSPDDVIDFEVRLYSGIRCEFYINNRLRRTITTNLPTSTDELLGIFWIEARTTSAAECSLSTMRGFGGG